MKKAREELLTPFGLRTLSPHDKDYCPVHNNEYSYHQGTIWPWLIGGFIEGCIVAYGREESLKILDGIGYFSALSETLEEFKSIPEIFDGNCQSVYAPRDRNGCKSQAWSVAESLRGLSLLFSPRDNPRDAEQKVVSSKVIYE